MKFQTALDIVADDYKQLAIDIFLENAYASHVPFATKLDQLRRGLELSRSVRYGNIKSFAILQRLNQALTGECIAFLP